MRYNTYTAILVIALYGFAQSFPLKVRSFSDIRWGERERQKYDNSCGLASISSMLSFYKISVTEDSLRILAKEELSSKGVNVFSSYQYSMLDLVGIARRIGYVAKGYKLNYENLLLLNKPCIAYLNMGYGGHFSVVLEVKRNSVFVFDPSQGYLDIPKNYFLSLFIQQKDEGKILIIETPNLFEYEHLNLITIKLPDLR